MVPNDPRSATRQLANLEHNKQTRESAPPGASGSIFRCRGAPRLNRTVALVANQRGDECLWVKPCFSHLPPPPWSSSQASFDERLQGPNQASSGLHSGHTHGLPLGSKGLHILHADACIVGTGGEPTAEVACNVLSSRTQQTNNSVDTVCPSKRYHWISV